MVKKNRLNQSFGRLTIVGEAESRRYPSGKIVRFLNCRCSCGNTHVTNINALRSGDTRSCGCLSREGNNRSHGMAGTRFYITWSGMKRRAGRDKYWKHVKLSKQWNDFNIFKEDMYKSYLKHYEKYGSVNTTLDRIDNKKGYSKENCRWATRLTQSRNRTYAKKRS